MEEVEELFFQGAPISDGIIIGKALFYMEEDEERSDKVPFTAVKVEKVDAEISRFRSAIFSSQQDLRSLQQTLVQRGSCEVAEIIGTHIDLLEDPLITKGVEDKIREKKKSSESAFRSVILDCSAKLKGSQDPFFRERLSDIADLSKRVLSHLTAKKRSFFQEIPEGSILFVKELAPTDAAILKGCTNMGIVMRTGLATSHTALIVKAKAIPCISGVGLHDLPKIAGKKTIINGRSGEIIVNPKEQTLAKYEKLLEKEMRDREQLHGGAPAQTLDGKQIELLSNAGNVADVKFSASYGATGIGLFRTELIYLEDPSFIHDEEKQFVIYSEVIQLMAPDVVNFRLFDLGGDKTSHLFLEEKESNPLLGCRGVRFLIKHEELFTRQLRALLRASKKNGAIQLIVPFVSEPAELELIRKKAQLISEELQMVCPAIGAMIELPSSALTVDLFADCSDFFSIGSNDLIQYTLCIDRGSAEKSDFFYSCQPSFIRLMKMIIDSARKLKKPVLICGEIASNPIFMPLLVGLGAERFSCSPRYLPQVKRVLAVFSSAACQELAEQVLKLSNVSEISEHLLQTYRLKLDGGAKQVLLPA